MKIILGIDPGFTITGYAIVGTEGQKILLRHCNFLRLPSARALPERTNVFYDFFREIIIQQQITDVALETPFLGKNTQSFLKLGYLRGILYLLSAQHKLAIHEFSPMQVKAAVTGFGGAKKEQVARFIYQLFPRLQQQNKLDVTDAIAVAVCCAWQNKNYVQQALAQVGKR